MIHHVTHVYLDGGQQADRYCAKAHVRIETTRVFTWRCPDCGTTNKTRRRQADDPTKQIRNIDHADAVRARCGHCHASARTLVDRKYRTFNP